MDSIWREGVVLPRFGKPEGDIRTDVLIIGGGITGILCAYFLQQKGVDYVLAEGRTICSGITGNTTAKITVQHGLIYQKMIGSIGVEKTSLYLQANQDAVQRYGELCKEIDCDFERKPSYVYSLDDRAKLEKEARVLEKIGCMGVLADRTELPFPVAGAIGFADQAQFQPLKFLARISKNLRIYENTFVREVTKNSAVTNQGKIHFKKVIIATHFPMNNKHGMYFLKLYQHRSYVIALKNAAQFRGMYVDEAKTGMSFRNYKEYLLVGGGGHRTGKEGGNWSELWEFARRYYPDALECGYWAAQDCMSLDHIPYIGRYSRSTPNCYVATGYNKWGITSSMVAARLLTDLIMEKENPYEEVFVPSRNILKPQLAVNGFEAVTNLLTISDKRCPHLGCALKWNAAEHSWDCPCHGSRFDDKGTLLNNPANGNLDVGK